MRFSRVYLSAPLTVVATTASSLCWVCDEEVVLTGEQARCFLDKYEFVETAIESDPDGYRLINFDACINYVANDFTFRGPGNLSRPDLNTEDSEPAPDAPPSTTDQKFAYILDTQTANCLRDAVEARFDALDPDITVDLRRCRPDE